ncbi:MAG: 50S ribosomal protein L25 [Candidatus Nanopelagicales bacterium]
MPEIAITAVPRSDFGKGAARRLRRSGQVPAVIYGKGAELKHVALPAHELNLALRKPGLVLDVSFEGTTTIVAPRDVQRDPVRRIVEHIDLVVIDKAEQTARIQGGLVIEAELAEAALHQEAPKGDMPLEDEAPAGEAETPESDS